MTTLLDPQTLRVIIEVDRERHMGRAAERLYMSPTAVSRHLGSAEQRLQTRLFARGGRGPVQPTAAGARAVADARRILAALEELPDSVRGGEEPGTRRIRIGVLGSGLGKDTAPIMAAWRELFPDVSVEFLALSGDDHDIALQSGRVDLAVICLTGEEEGLDTHVAYSTRRAVVAPLWSEFADAEELRPDDVADAPWLFSRIPRDLEPLWSDLPVLDAPRTTVLSDPAHVAPAVAATGRLANHSMAAEPLGVPGMVRFVPLTGPSVDIGAAVRQGEQRPAVRTLLDIVQVYHTEEPSSNGS
ncbi:LysR family transcriptional regulator [Nocardiopsis coralliicola]